VAAKVLSGGEALEQKLADIARNLSKASSVKVGFLEGATYSDGTSVAMIAAIQDFGAPSVGIPPRPFFRNMIAAKKGEWPKAMADLAKAHNYDGEVVLKLMGEGIAGQLRQSIVDTNEPPNAPSTLRGKKGTKPLVDTGMMLQSVDFSVE